MGTLVITYAISELKSYISRDYMVTGALRQDICRLCMACKFHGKTVHLVGGDAGTYGLLESYQKTQAEVIALLRENGEVAFTAEDMVKELAPHVHVREDGRLDKWHFAGNSTSEAILSRRVDHFIQVPVFCYFDLPCLAAHRKNISAR